MHHGGLDGTTTAVAEDNDEGNLQLGDSRFDTALDRHASAAHDIAGDAHNENIAHAHIEEDLWSDAGIRTTDDDGVGILTFRKGTKLLRAAPRTCGLAFDEAGVAVEEVLPGLVGADGRRSFAGGCFFLRRFLV